MNASYENTENEFNKSVASCRLVTVAEAKELLKGEEEFALDFETTSLDPAHGDIRITSICNDNVHFIIDHRLGGSFKALIPSLRGKTLWVYNAKFETKWCDFHMQDADFADLLDIRDVDFLAKAVIGGHPSSLAKMCARDLKILLNKDEQNSGWHHDTLTKSQLDYAGFDSYVTWGLFKHWDAKCTDEQYDAGLFVFNDAVRGTIEAETTGLYLDSGYHEKTVTIWEIKRNTFERYLRKFTPAATIPNLRSDLQIGKYLKTILAPEVIESWPKTEKTKQMQFEGKYLRDVSRNFGYPFNRWLAALAGYKYYNKYLSTYGDTLLNSAALSGKVFSRFNIGQAATGRYSSSQHNLQNIPRKVVVRTAFCSPHGGELTMTLADYKGVEIRTLAEISGDEQLLHDAIYSDVHAASAAAIYGHDLAYVLEVLESGGEGRYGNAYVMIKAQRSIAKAFTFQLLYGAGPAALSYILKCDFEEACAAINAWAARYPKAYNYRNVIFDHMNANNGMLPVHDGRTIWVHYNDRTLPVASNYGVQGAAASVMYRCMYRVHKLFHQAGIPAWIAATVHDELLCYAEPEFAEEAMQLQIQGMTEAWLDIFPGSNTDNLADWAIGDTWAAKP